MMVNLFSAVIGGALVASVTLDPGYAALIVAASIAAIVCNHQNL